MIPTPCVAPISYAFPCFSLLPGLHTIPAEGLALQPPPGASVLGGQFIKHFLLILQAEDGPHKRGWLLAAHTESYQGGKRHSFPTLSIHSPCLPLLQKLFSSWSLLSDFLFTAEDHWPWSVSETECDLSRPTYSGRIAGWPGGAATSVEIAHLYPKLPKPSPPPPSKRRCLRIACAAAPYRVCGRSS